MDPHFKVRPIAGLNARQSEVLDLLCAGLTNVQIAQIVGLSPRSIKSYVSELLLIFGVANRTELAGTVGPYRASAQPASSDTPI